MTKYFDKDFFRFFMGFVAILLVSLTIIIATRVYEEQSFVEESPNSATAIKSIVP